MRNVQGAGLQPVSSPQLGCPPQGRVSRCVWHLPDCSRLFLASYGRGEMQRPPEGVTVTRVCPLSSSNDAATTSSSTKSQEQPKSSASF